MAYSMMSSTDHKRKFELLPKAEADDCCSFDENTATDDWISLDLDFLVGDYDDENEKGFFCISSSSETSSDYSDDAASAYPVHGNKRENLMMSKKRKAMETFVDQELEDTASSPAQSPKDNNFNLFYMNMKSKELESRETCQENGNTSQQPGDITNMNLLESDLRKKGLCLIPTSMLLNYLSAIV